ncbi:hypothetical protein [Bacillus sp. REN16]|uniref:hypothetical protein n=1 Tax=Bacillus sp. REN16 TaxID=2887296 RepID=UPI001E5ACD90|nr:hypothetical protein [Bacillus sp. REN16]MCC3359120.1 hypothetical protein [Bacillus sp. REN16]
MKVKDLYIDAICYEEVSLAHYIHHLLEVGKISLEDDASKLDLDHADHEKVREMIENNVLGFHKIGVYALKKNRKEFVFIFAETEQAAIEFFAKLFQQAPLYTHTYSLHTQILREHKMTTFWDMRKEHLAFPAIAGYFEK